MEENISELLSRFEDIKRKQWILVPKRGYGENGLLFEQLLGIKNNDLSIPDFNGIELKVHNKYSNFPITLFSLFLDGPAPNELRRFVERYGAYDSTFKSSKILYITLNTKYYSKWGKSLMMKLSIDKKNKKVHILVSHSNGKIIEKKSYWYFDSILDVLCRKVSFLCVVNNSSKYIKNKKYTYYYDINIFKLMAKELLINAIIDGKIFVQIKYGIYKSGCKVGEPYNHGIAFQINYDDLGVLYKKI